MDIYITTDEELHTLQLSLDIDKLNITQTLRALQALYAHHTDLHVHINRALIPGAYVKNPSMMADKTRDATCFVYSRGKYEGIYVVATFTNSPEPAGFMARAIKHIITHDHTMWYRFRRNEVPMTYQTKLELLRYRIKQSTGYKIITVLTADTLKIRRCALSQQPKNVIDAAEAERSRRDIDYDQELN